MDGPPTCRYRYAEVLPTPLYSDNQCAIRLVRNPKFHRQTKHIDIVYHLIWEFQAKGEIVIEYISTNQQFANILTKALSLEKFQGLRSALNIIKKVGV